MADLVTGLQILNITAGTHNNSMVAQVGDVISGNVESYTAQYVQQVGFCSIPPKAIPGISAADCILFKEVSRDFILATRDVASQANYGNLSYGETALYAAGANGTAQGRCILKGDGSVTLFTTDDNTATGNGVSLGITPTAFSFKAPWGKMTFDKTGLHISTISGASLDMIGVADPITGNAVTITTGNCTVNSGTINLGPVTGVNLPAAVSIIPAAVPGVPLLGAGVGAVVLNVVASTVVNIGSGI